MKKLQSIVITIDCDDIIGMIRICITIKKSKNFFLFLFLNLNYSKEKKN